MPTDIHSTGRGGAGNIGKDTTPYTDAGIIRESNAEHAGSAGRGGAGNISPHMTPTQSPAPDARVPIDHSKHAHGPSALRNSTTNGEDIVPELDLHPAENQPNFHTGRGGAGNEHREKFGGHSTRAEQEAADARDKEKEHEAHGGIVGKVKGALGLAK